MATSLGAAVYRSRYDEEDGKLDDDERWQRFERRVEHELMLLEDRADHVIRCSFCSKSQSEVAKIIAGPTVYICNECIALCNDILAPEDAAP